MIVEQRKHTLFRNHKGQVHRLPVAAELDNVESAGIGTAVNRGGSAARGWHQHQLLYEPPLERHQRCLGIARAAELKPRPLGCRLWRKTHRKWLCPLDARVHRGKAIPKPVEGRLCSIPRDADDGLANAPVHGNHATA